MAAKGNGKNKSRADRLTEPSYANHWITSKMRMWKSAKCAFTKDNLETKSFTEMSNQLDAESCDSRRRPAIGLSVMASTLIKVTDMMVDEWAENRLHGEGYKWLTRAVQKHKSAFHQLDSFAEDVVRTDQSILLAVTEVMGWFRSMSRNDDAKEFVMVLIEKSVKELHLARQMLEWISFAENIPATARAIGYKDLQRNGQELDAIGRKVDSKEATERMNQWLANSVLGKNEEHDEYTKRRNTRQHRQLYVSIEQHQEVSEDNIVEALPIQNTPSQSMLGLLQPSQMLQSSQGMDVSQMMSMMQMMFSQMQQTQTQPSTLSSQLEIAEP